MAEFTITQLGEGDEREYAVFRDGRPWLQVAMSPETYAIGWPATTIENFDRVVRRELPKRADITPPEEFDIRVIMQEPREYLELHLPKDESTYGGIIERLDRVSFIRYDNHVYSFTATHPSNEPQLAVRLDRSIPLNASLTSWILEHHRNGDMSTADFENLFRSIE